MTRESTNPIESSIAVSVDNEEHDPSTAKTVTVKVPRGPGNIRWPIYLAVAAYAVPACILAAKHFVPATVLFAGVVLALAWAIHACWLKYVVRGRKIAIIFAYIMHLPCLLIVLSMLTFVSFHFLTRLMDAGGMRILAVGLSYLIIILSVLRMFVANVMSPGLRTWLTLNGRCPVCLNWRFARGKVHTTEQCAKCGAEIVFEWAE